MENHNFQDLVTMWLLPAFLSSIVAFVLGLVWYHPSVLGGKWLEARNLLPNDVPKHSTPFILSFPLWFLTALFYSFLLISMGISGFAEIFLFSCMLWVAFSMPPLVMGSLYTGYPFNAVAIDASYQLAGYYALGLTHLGLKALGVL